MLVISWSKLCSIYVVLDEVEWSNSGDNCFSVAVADFFKRKCP